MKKIITTLIVFLVVGFLICFGVSMFIPIPADVPEKSVFVYKFCNGLLYFFMLLPPMLGTGFIISCSVHFGHNAEGSTEKFSQAMFGRYKTVLITSLIMIFVMVLSNELFGVMVKRKQKNIINKPKIITEYINVAENLYDNGFYERSLAYANSVLKMEPNLKAAQEIKNKSTIEINKLDAGKLHFDLTNNHSIFKEAEDLKIDGEKITESWAFYKKAKEAFENQQWFNAHYYAETGLRLTSSKDPNYDSLKQLSAEAWNNITAVQPAESSEEAFFYKQKYEGYKALMEHDDLQAYYIFQFLIANYIEMQRDSDVNFYFDIARDRVEQKYFFTDETFELSSFEDANDVHFAYTYMNGEKAVVYFKGITSIKATGQAVQYLRDLYIIYFDNNGYWKYTLHTPYAKVRPVSVENINVVTKSMLGINENTKFVPYMLLKSVSRDDENLACEPVQIKAGGKETKSPSDYILFPLEYDTFVMLENSPTNPETSSILNLIKFASKADDYGYSSEKYGQVLINRLLYPLFLLVLFILIGAISWNIRLGSTQYFKFSWIFIFPFLTAVLMVIFQGLLYLFKLINYVFFGLAGGISGIWMSAAFQLILLIIASIYFLSRSSKE